MATTPAAVSANKAELLAIADAVAREKLIDKGIVAGGLLAGAGAFAVLKGQGLALLFSAFIAYAAVQMMLDRKPRPGRALPGPWGQAGVGAGVGFVSALLGAGGAFLSVPFMIWCNVPVRHAVGTSAALGFPIAAASTLGYAISGWRVPAALPGAVGYIYLPALAVVAVASISLAPLGARTECAASADGRAPCVAAARPTVLRLAACAALPPTP